MLVDIMFVYVFFHVYISKQTLLSNKASTKFDQRTEQNMALK